MQKSCSVAFWKAFGKFSGVGGLRLCCHWLLVGNMERCTFNNTNASDCVFRCSWCPRFAFSWFLGLIDLRRTSGNSKQVSSWRATKPVLWCLFLSSWRSKLFSHVLLCEINLLWEYDMVRSERRQEPWSFISPLHDQYINLKKALCVRFEVGAPHGYFDTSCLFPQIGLPLGVAKPPRFSCLLSSALGTPIHLLLADHDEEKHCGSMRQISPLAQLAQRFASRTWVLRDPWICDEGVLKYVAVLWGTYARLFFVFFSLLSLLDYFCSFFFLLLLLIFICFSLTQKPGTGVFPPLLIWHRRVHNQLETFQLPLTHPLRCKGKQLLSVARHEA